MLYKKNAEKFLRDELFQNPTSEYRGAPFWAWNTRLDSRELLRQIDIFKQMGLGGFFCHSRVGLATPYMEDEFMDMVAKCNQKAIDNDMLCFLYDEDRWPSGSAGGIVTQNHDYRERLLIFCPYGHKFNKKRDPGARYAPKGDRRLLGRYNVVLEKGCLSHYDFLRPNEQPAATVNIWEAYLDYVDDSPWFNNQGYVDTLNKKAIDKFIEVTHERYKQRLGDNFGKSINAIFTDEPQFWAKGMFNHSDAKHPVTLPFTTDFEETYRKKYGESLLAHLPEIFWELSNGKVSKARYQFHDHVCERFTEAFIDNIGRWCEENGIMLTGHMMEEPTLHSQTRVVGEAMRGYRKMQLPGIDMLCDHREFSTAKQCQSTARQYGREGVLSELYGVTNWDFDFRGHKLQGDWQAALGVTLRVHHLTWVTMAGEAKRDYPACIGYQSPWYEEYAYVENHFARLNTALTRGRPVVKVAVIHPIESFWLRYGPKDKTAEVLTDMEADFKNIISWLLFSQIDFDFVSESLLPELYTRRQDSKFSVGEMDYDAVLVPNCLSLRGTTLNALKNFHTAGGKVIFAGEVAQVVDGEDSSVVVEFAKNLPIIPFARSPVVTALEEFKDISIQNRDGSRAEHLLYQLRQDGDDKWLFIANGTKPNNNDLPRMEEITLYVKGEYAPTLYDTLTGSITPLHAKYNDGVTVIKREMYMHDGLLLKLAPGRSKAKPPEKPAQITKAANIPAPYAFELSEPNVLVLDMAEYAFNNGEWQPKEEILRVDNLFRNHLKYPLRMQSLAQPWTLGTLPAPQNILNLRFTISSEISLDEVFLALENPEATEIVWNGESIDINHIEGYFVDKSIKKILLPGLRTGENRLTLHIKFDRRTNVENCYLLGKFGVKLAGQTAIVTSYPTNLHFGDITRQELPFYGGNVTYKCRIYSEGIGRMMLEVSYFRAPVITARLNGEKAGIIAYAPYRADLGYLPEGWHELEITAYGNRINTFGTLHNSDEKLTWVGPQAWRSTGHDWSYEYIVKPTGILKSPKVIYF